MGVWTRWRHAATRIHARRIRRREEAAARAEAKRVHRAAFAREQDTARTRQQGRALAHTWETLTREQEPLAQAATMILGEFLDDSGQPRRRRHADLQHALGPTLDPQAWQWLLHTGLVARHVVAPTFPCYRRECTATVTTVSTATL